MTDSRESSNRPDEMEAVKTTIVGGRPPGSGKAVGPIPRGIEVLIKKAAVDAEFRELLLSRRAASADEIGLTLTPAEKMMLDAAPADQLARIIGQTRVDPAVRPALLGRVAAAMLLALGLTGAIGTVGCPPFSYGVSPDRIPTPPPPATDTPVPLGVRPDRPAVQPREDLGGTKGSRPDRPIQPDAPVQPGEFASPDINDSSARYATLLGIRPPATQPHDDRNQARASLRKADQPADNQADDGPREFAGVRPGMRPRPAQPVAPPAPATQPAEQAPATQPAEAVDPAVRARVDRLVGHLEPKPAMAMAGVAPRTDPSPQEAEQALVLIGPPALPVLREKLADGKLPAESETRVKRIIETIVKNAQPKTQPEAIRGIQPDRP